MIASDVIVFGVENKNTVDFCSFFDSRLSWKIILFFAQEDFKRNEFRLFHKLSENHVMPNLGKTERQIRRAIAFGDCGYALFLTV